MIDQYHNGDLPVFRLILRRCPHDTVAGKDVRSGDRLLVDWSACQFREDILGVNAYRGQERLRLECGMLILG